MMVSTADDFCNQFGCRSGLTKPGPNLDPNCFDTNGISERIFFKNVDFEKYQQIKKKHEKLPSRQRVKMV